MTILNETFTSEQLISNDHVLIFEFREENFPSSLFNCVLSLSNDWGFQFVTIQMERRATLICCGFRQFFNSSRNLWSEAEMKMLWVKCFITKRKSRRTSKIFVPENREHLARFLADGILISSEAETRKFLKRNKFLISLDKTLNRSAKEKQKLFRKLSFSFHPHLHTSCELNFLNVSR